MAAWLKVLNPGVEVGDGIDYWGTAIIDLERADAFGVPAANEVAVIVDGVTFIVRQDVDPDAYNSLVAYAQRITGKTLV